MKRAQKVALAGCAGRCPEAQELQRDLDESAEALDRAHAEVQALRESIRVLQDELVLVRALLRCRRGLVP